MWIEHRSPDSSLLQYWLTWPRHTNPDWTSFSLSALVKPGGWSFTSDLLGLWDSGLGLALQKLLPLSQQLPQSYNYHHLLNMTTEALCN